ncbi:MAG: ATP-binding protein [Gemmatimonadales bacterium]
MTALRSETWAEANQAVLMAAVARVRAALERRAATLGGAGPEPSVPESSAEAPSSSALDTLVAAFGLSAFERDVLVLCAGVELDASFAACCAAGQSDPSRPYPTFGMALAALPGAHWSALSPAAPLRRWRLVEVAGDLVTQGQIRIDERVLHYLAGVSHLDVRLEGIADPVPVPTELPPSQEAAARRIATFWSSWSGASEWPVVQLIGDSAGAARVVAARACAAIQLGLHTVRVGDVPAGAEEREAFVRLWAREAVLERSGLLLEAEELEGAERARIRALTERLTGLVLISLREPLSGIRRADLRLDVRRPLPQEQLALWHEHLGITSARLNGRLDAVVAHFSLDADSIRSACATVLGAPPSAAEPSDDLDDLIWDVCRAQARSRLDQLAQRIEPVAEWEELVLPAAQRTLLAEIAGQVRQRSRVYEMWGLGGAGKRGLGITALFAGPSGTGKTMAAEVLARELRLDLYRIDLSQVVSKYVGETEKNLRRVFDAAEGGGAILLFDEADALFGKRSEVRDSHDRYANIEISYLLQRMEDYRGLALLTTNLKTALDPAFVRRLRFVISFPFPDALQREEIWRRAFPSLTPTAGLDPARLARLNVAGGDVRNIAMHAAFLAAEAGQPVRMAHLLRAARGEYVKLEKTLTEVEVEGWT